jgi:hypothetical protein
MARAKTEKTVRTIMANELQLAKVTLVLEGIGNGYLSNKFPDETMEAIAAKQDLSGGAPAKKVRNYQKDFEQSLRIDENGCHCMPGSGLKKALVRASKATGAKMVDVGGSFQILEPLLPITNSKANLFRRAVKGGRIACCARFPNEPKKPWLVHVEITYDTQQMSPEILIDLANRAGFFVGIGAWRPEKNGAMGMFKVRNAIDSK